MNRIVRSSVAVLVVSLATTLSAHAAIAVPEISTSGSIGGIVLLCGAALILRGRKPLQNS